MGWGRMSQSEGARSRRVGGGRGSTKPGTALGAQSRTVESHSFHNIIVP